MKKLLVAMDGSGNAERAVAHAAKLAKLTGASLHLLYVCEAFADADRAHAYYSLAELEKPARERGAALLQAGEAIARAEGVDAVGEMVFGDIAHTIVTRADELGADGIVMGTRGLGKLANLFLGSIASKVVAETKLPVTLVK